MDEVPYHIPIDKVFVLELICFGRFNAAQIEYLQEIGPNIIQQVWPALFDSLKGVEPP